MSVPTVSDSDSAPSRPRSRRLSPAARKAVVLLHVVSSVGWLSLMLCLLTLGVSGLVTRDAETLRSSYRAMRILGDALIVPLSLLSLTSGLALALGTPWRLFQYRWVSTKFWLTLAATTASVFALTARLHEAADLATGHPTGSIADMHLGFARYNMVIVPSVALTLYLVTVTLSVFKPWGRRTGWKADGT